MTRFFVKTLLLMCAALGSLTGRPALAADCPAGADPVYCQMAEATGGKVISGSPDEVAAQLNTAMADRMNPVVLAPETPLEALLQFRLEYLAPFLAAFIPLTLMLVLMRKAPRRPYFHWFYGAVCAAGPLGFMMIIFAIDVAQHGFAPRIDLRVASMITVSVLGFVCIPLVTLWAILSWLSKGNKLALWGGAVSSALATLWLTYYVLWIGVH